MAVQIEAQHMKNMARTNFVQSVCNQAGNYTDVSGTFSDKNRA